MTKAIKNNISQDLFGNIQPTVKPRHVYTVSEITKDIKIILENTFTDVWVEGEVSGLTKISTGTIFFSLKDSSSLLKCVIFPSCASGINFEIKDGLKFVCFGRIGVYERDGKYQLYVEKIEPAGVGSLQLALEQLKQKLEKEGLFSAARKRQIPYLPARIGVVTSPQGAALKDILKVLERRFKDCHIIISPASVQGEGAKEEIACAIADLNKFNDKLPPDSRIEVMIVGRGGGSVEDLWAFNEEIVARAIFNSQIPVISAVGHERDWTVSDLVADLRAPTPSVAAELVIPKKEDLQERLDGLARNLKATFLDIARGFQEDIDGLAHNLGLNIVHSLQMNINRFNSATKKLSLLNPITLITQYKARTIDLARQIYIRAGHLVQLRYASFIKAAEKLSSLSPLNILSRGYSITFKFTGGESLKDAAGVKSGDLIKTKLHSGELLSQVKEIKKDGGDKV